MNDEFGGFDVAVVGGGVAATMCASSLADQGLKVIVLADSSSLMHELGLSRLNVADTEELAQQLPEFQSWVNLISCFNGRKGNAFEPILVQLLADRFMQRKKIEVLFEVRPVQLLLDENQLPCGVQIATRSGLRNIPCQAVVDCSDHASLMSGLGIKVEVNPESVSSIWTLTMIGGDPIEQPVGFTFEMNEARYEVRVQPSYWEGELAISVAVSSLKPEHREELAVMAVLEGLLQLLREQANFQLGNLIHVCERPWAVPAFIWKENSSTSMNAEAPPLWSGHDQGRIIGIGPWVEAIADRISAVSKWRQGETAMNLLIHSSVEAGKRIAVTLAEGGSSISLKDGNPQSLSRVQK
jgi:hypothetical protein